MSYVMNFFNWQLTWSIAHIPSLPTTLQKTRLVFATKANSKINIPTNLQILPGCNAIGFSDEYLLPL